MKVEKLGKLLIDRKIKHSIRKGLENCLDYADRFLVYLSKNKPDLVDSYISNLKLKLESQIINKSKFTNKFDFNSLVKPLEILQKYQDLGNGIANLHLSLLNLPDDFDWEQETISILHIDSDKGYYYPRYYLIKSLTEILDRNEAIQLVKNFIDERVKKHVQRPHRETMTEVFELDIENGKNSESSVYVSALLNEGLYAGRVDRCMGHEALKELNEPKLTELITCYHDFEMVKKTNKHFILTRTCTLHTGPYCDNLYHDTRIVKKTKHLSREFYDNLDKKK